MSKADVEAVFGPRWVQDARRHAEARALLAEKIVLALRRRMRSSDPRLPDEHDGTSWAEIEKDWLR